MTDLDFRRTIRDGGGVAALLVYADWLEEHGHCRESAAVRRRASRRPKIGSGDGYGYGYGYGYDSGDGYGYDSGDGDGYGYGSGDGYGYDSGDGYGSN